MFTMVPMCIRQSEQRGRGFRQLGQEESRLVLVVVLRGRGSSNKAFDTDLPQKLHDRNTVRELREEARMPSILMSSSARFSHRPQLLR